MTDEQIKNAEHARHVAETNLAYENARLAAAQKAHIEAETARLHKRGFLAWLDRHGHQTIASIVIAGITAWATIQLSKNDVRELQRNIETAEQTLRSLQAGLNDRTDEAVVRDFWVAHVLRSIEHLVPDSQGGAYKRYVQNYYKVVNEEYQRLAPEVKARIEKKYNLIIEKP